MNKIFGFAAVLLCGLFFAGCSEEDSKVLDDLTGLRSDIGSIPEGSISVLVTLGSGTNSLLTTLTDTKYLFKSFGSVKELTSASGTSYEYSNMKLFWKAIYLKNYDELSKDQSTGIPAQLQKSTQSTYSSVSDFDLENFSWKRLLAAYLLNSLE